MKLCQKCQEAIISSLMPVLTVDNRPTDVTIKGGPTVPESECEFWAHKDLIGLIAWVKQFAKYLQERGIIS